MSNKTCDCRRARTRDLRRVQAKEAANEEEHALLVSVSGLALFVERTLSDEASIVCHEVLHSQQISLQLGQLLVVLLNKHPTKNKHFETVSQCRKTQKDPLGFFIIQLVAENQNYQRGGPLVTSKNFGGKSLNVEKPVNPTLLSCLVTKKALKTKVPKKGTLWKHPLFLSSKVGMSTEIL